jgi:predicted lipoprotein with Yx(FWY)xxD motif
MVARRMRIPSGKGFNRTAMLVGLAALVLAGCGSVEPQLGQVRQTSIGPVLVDGSGYTLYVHGEDPPGVSHCTPACTVYWPPVEATDDARSRGDFSIIVRESGVRQWAYRGKPLYRFALEIGPGHTGGDGAADGDWHVARP